MSSWQSYAVVMAGGALGAAARMAVSGGIANYFGASFPWGTLVANVSGCFLIGLVAALTGPDSPLLVSPLARQMLMIGVLGGYTTFSSFTLQTVELAANGEWLAAAGNVAASMILCLAATAIGMALPSLLMPRLFP